jgi:hypothetical protein
MSGEPIKFHCCELDCNAPAEWSIHYGPGPEDCTDACARHLADLLEPDVVNHVHPIAESIALSTRR